MYQVKQFNTFVGSLCRTAYLPWCACCNAPISKDCAQAMAIFPGKRYCRVCKLSSLFISDLELADKYGIKLSDRLPGEMKKVEAPPVVSTEVDDDDDEEALNIVAPKRRQKKKAAGVRPPPARKPSSTKRKHTNPFYRRDANGDWATTTITPPAEDKRRTVLQFIVTSGVFFIAHSGSRHQRCSFTSNSINLAGPLMNQRLNMLFFRMTDIEKLFDLKKARALKLRRDNAISLLGAVFMRRNAERDINWAMPFTTMTPSNRHIVWDRIVTTRQFRATNALHVMYPPGWEPLNAVDMQYAQAHQHLGY
jgi:hypothetical protein